jgi:signal peptidase II
MIWQSRGGPALTLVALGLVLGGAAGNLFDRVASGSVTDFIQVFIGSYEWPSFNVADSAITVGALLLGWDMIRARERKQHGAT